MRQVLRLEVGTRLCAGATALAAGTARLSSAGPGAGPEGGLYHHLLPWRRLPTEGPARLQVSVRALRNRIPPSPAGPVAAGGEPRLGRNHVPLHEPSPCGLPEEAL